MSQRDVTFTLAGSEELVGKRLGISPWVFIDQTQVNVFAEVTR